MSSLFGFLDHLCNSSTSCHKRGKGGEVEEDVDDRVHKFVVKYEEEDEDDEDGYSEDENDIRLHGASRYYNKHNNTSLGVQKQKQGKGTYKGSGSNKSSSNKHSPNYNLAESNPLKWATLHYPSFHTAELVHLLALHNELYDMACRMPSGAQPPSFLARLCMCQAKLVARHGQAVAVEESVEKQRREEAEAMERLVREGMADSVDALHSMLGNTDTNTHTNTTDKNHMLMTATEKNDLTPQDQQVVTAVEQILQHDLPQFLHQSQHTSTSTSTSNNTNNKPTEVALPLAKLIFAPTTQPNQTFPLLEKPQQAAWDADISSARATSLHWFLNGAATCLGRTTGQGGDRPVLELIYNTASHLTTGGDDGDSSGGGGVFARVGELSAKTHPTASCLLRVAYALSMASRELHHIITTAHTTTNDTNNNNKTTTSTTTTTTTTSSCLPKQTPPSLQAMIQSLVSSAMAHRHKPTSPFAASSAMANTTLTATVTSQVMAKMQDCTIAWEEFVQWHTTHVPLLGERSLVGFMSCMLTLLDKNGGRKDMEVVEEGGEPSHCVALGYPTLKDKSFILGEEDEEEDHENHENHENHGGEGLGREVSPYLFSLASMSPHLSGKWHRIYASDQDGLSFPQLHTALMGYGGPTLLVIRALPRSNTTNNTTTTNNKFPSIFGAYTTHPWKDSGVGFYGTNDCFLYQLSPKVGMYRSTPQGRNFMYCHAGGGGCSSSGSGSGGGRSRTSRADPVRPQQAQGLGLGGTMTQPRLFLSQDLEHCVAHYRDSTFVEGHLLPPPLPQQSQSQPPQQRGRPSPSPSPSAAAATAPAENYTFSIDAMEVWGVGGDQIINPALQARGKHRSVVQSHLEKSRKVDKKQFLDDFNSGLIESKAFQHRNQVRGRAEKCYEVDEYRK